MLYDTAVHSSTRRVPIRSGRAYQSRSLPQSELITGELADELQKVLEAFATDSGFSERNPVAVFFRPGIFGHHKMGRAVDIYGVGGVGMDSWKKRWDAAMQNARCSTNRATSIAARHRERQRNLGWRLYRALQCYGRWAQPEGYPIQLFGPWTRTAGPWKFISDRLLLAHRDHIHVAK